MNFFRAESFFTGGGAPGVRSCALGRRNCVPGTDDRKNIYGRHFSSALLVGSFGEHLTHPGLFSGRVLIRVDLRKSILARNRAYSNGFSGGPAPLVVHAAHCQRAKKQRAKLGQFVNCPVKQLTRG